MRVACPPFSFVYEFFRIEKLCRYLDKRFKYESLTAIKHNSIILDKVVAFPQKTLKSQIRLGKVSTVSKQNILLRQLCPYPCSHSSLISYFTRFTLFPLKFSQKPSQMNILQFVIFSKSFSSPWHNFRNGDFPIWVRLRHWEWARLFWYSSRFLDDSLSHQSCFYNLLVWRNKWEITMSDGKGLVWNLNFWICSIS